MKAIEEVRQAVMTLFKTLHTTNYPTMLVNYPNRVSVDTENLTAPFISVEITAGGDVVLDDLGSRDVRIEGLILINYLQAIGRGTTGSAAYSDMLNAGMCNQKIGGVTYGGLKIYNVSPAPGIVGQSNKITFQA